MNRAIVVTGSASGLGKATTELLEEKGDRVIRVDIKEGDVLADLGTVEGRVSAVEEIKETSPEGIDGVITWAGIGGPTPKTFTINYFGTVELLEGLRPLLEKSQAPRVVVTSSRMSMENGDDNLLELLLENKEEETIAKASEYPDDIDTANLFYATSKIALARWMRKKSASPEWGGKGILINAIAPGLIETPLTKPVLENPETGQGLLDVHPQVEQKLSQPKEIGEVAKFLLSAENSLLVGQCLFADRGTEVLIRGDKVW